MQNVLAIHPFSQPSAEGSVDLSTDSSDAGAAPFSLEEKAGKQADAGPSVAEPATASVIPFFWAVKLPDVPPAPAGEWTPDLQPAPSGAGLSGPDDFQQLADPAIAPDAGILPTAILSAGSAPVPGADLSKAAAPPLAVVADDTPAGMPGAISDRSSLALPLQAGAEGKDPPSAQAVSENQADGIATQIVSRPAMPALTEGPAANLSGLPEPAGTTGASVPGTSASEGARGLGPAGAGDPAPMVAMPDEDRAAPAGISHAWGPAIGSPVPGPPAAETGQTAVPLGQVAAFPGPAAVAHADTVHLPAEAAGLARKAQTADPLTDPSVARLQGPDASMPAAARPDGLPRPHVAGFWERFLTAEPAGDSTSGPVAAMGPTALVGASLPAAADDRPFARMDALPGAPATANPQVLTAPTALPQTATAGLPVQPADPVLPAGEPLLDAVAGSGLQSLMAAFPSGGGLTVAASPSGPQTTLAVPQTIAQITAGLVASPNGITELALAPEELGHVRLRLEPDAAQPDRMLVMISVERPETLDLLRRHAGELADALRDAGYSGADIGFSQNGSQDQARSQHPHADQGPALGHDDPPPPPARPAVAGATLDLRL